MTNNCSVGDRVSVVTDGGHVMIQSGSVTFLGDDGRVEVVGDGNVSGMWPADFVKPLQNTTYESVVQKIGEGTVTAADFNNLIEATDKSTRERVLRHSRTNNPEPGQASMAGRVVPKKRGRNDPPRQGRGRRFAAGTPAKERQNQKQREHHARSVAESIAVLGRCHGAPVEKMAEAIKGADQDIIASLRAVASAFLRDRGARLVVESAIGHPLDCDWLFGLVRALDGVLAESGARQSYRFLFREKREKRDETRKYEVTAYPDQLDKLEQFFKWIQSCGSIGHSGSAELSVDGDGSARIKFKGLKKDLEPVEISDRARGPELKIGID